MSIYLSVFDCVWERAQILASQILPSVDKLQHTMIHESKGKLYPQNHQASLYSNKCCRASVLFLYQTTIYLTFQKVLHQNLQEFHIKISIEVFQSQRRKTCWKYQNPLEETARKLLHLLLPLQAEAKLELCVHQHHPVVFQELKQNLV